MMTQTQRTRMPGELSSPRAKLVYLFLTTREGATIEEIGDGLDMKKLALFSVLKTLRSRDLVERDGDRYRAR